MVGASPRRLGEAAALFGITLVVTVGLTWLQGSVAWVRAYLLVAVAATFLYLPIEVLHRRGEDPRDFGIHRRNLGRNLRLALLVIAITFPPYLVGFHAWQQNWLGRHLDISAARFDRWPVEIESPPEIDRLREGEVRLYTAEWRDNARALDETFVLEWHLHPGQNFRADLDSDAPVRVHSGAHLVRSRDNELRISGGSDGRVVFEVPGRSLDLGIEAGGDRLPTERLRLGTALVAADAAPYRAERGYLWLLNLILMQILLVALPEEVFYRGYLQTRFDHAFGRDVRVLGVSVNIASLLATSALFAIGHFLVIPSPQRLAVFFPSLLFGWMRRATGGVTAAVVFHAACNVLVEMAGRFYSG